jgi:hypothetical protein
MSGLTSKYYKYNSSLGMSDSRTGGEIESSVGNQRYERVILVHFRRVQEQVPQMYARCTSSHVSMS